MKTLAFNILVFALLLSPACKKEEKEDPKPVPIALQNSENLM